ncbi:MAG: glycoside hydrolase family 43 protein [Limisphaerales bacterium]
MARTARSILLAIFVATTSLFAGTFVNPVLSDGADPWVIYENGYYYFTDTTGGSVKISKATRLAGTNGIGNAVLMSTFTPPAPYNKEVWAPELHLIQGTNYIYYAADDGTNANHRMFAAVQHGQTTTFDFLGKVYDASTDRWAIDGTVLEADNGALYFIWSGWPGSVDGLQNLYIAPMSNPWTISGPRVLLSTPQRSWESWIQEGPTALKRNGKVFLVYAANLSWTDNECLGMLVNSDGNFLNAASWTKQSQPVFKTMTSTNGSVYGPGHCSLSQSLDGTEDWIFYHAAKTSGSGWDRDVRMQKFTWDPNGYPNFGQPIPAGIAINNPSGDDFTAAILTSVTLLTNNQCAINARAPLPLLTNKWAIESSGDLKTWSTITNVVGTQYTVQATKTRSPSNTFFRIKSIR